MSVLLENTMSELLGNTMSVLLGNTMSVLSGGCQTGAGDRADDTAGWHGDLDIFGRAGDHLRRKVGDVDALGFVLVRCGDDLGSS